MTKIDAYFKLHAVLQDLNIKLAAKDYDHFLPQLVDALLGIEDKLNEVVSAVDALEQRDQKVSKG